MENHKENDTIQFFFCLKVLSDPLGILSSQMELEAEKISSRVKRENKLPSKGKQQARTLKAQQDWEFERFTLNSCFESLVAQ